MKKKLLFTTPFFSLIFFIYYNHINTKRIEENHLNKISSNISKINKETIIKTKNSDNPKIKNNKSIKNKITEASLKETVAKYNNIQTKVLKSKEDEENFNEMINNYDFFKKVSDNLIKSPAKIDDDTKNQRYTYIDILVKMIREDVSFKSEVLDQIQFFLKKPIDKNWNTEVKQYVAGDKAELFTFLKKNYAERYQSLLRDLDPINKKISKINAPYYK